MFCRKCGKEIKDNMNFCPYCGFDCHSSVSSQIVEEESKPQEFSLNESDKLSNISLIFLICSIVNLIISFINLGLIVKIITLSISIGLMFFCLFYYLKKRIKYDFLSFSINLTSMVLNIGLIVYISILI